jgi:carbon storage regulator
MLSEHLQGGRMLVLSRSIGASIIIGQHIVVKIIQINGDKVRLGIEAPRETPIRRADMRQDAVSE